MTCENNMPARKCWTAAELRRLPPAEREAILREVASEAEPIYRNDPELTAFDAFVEDDLHVDSSSTETR